MAFSDEELIPRICAGETKLFELLVKRYQDKIFTLASRILKNREDAEEAAQDAFVRAFRALSKFHGDAQFGTWLYRIAYNVCLTKLESRKNIFQSLDAAFDADDDDEYHPEVAIEPSAVDTEFEKAETKEIVRKTLAKLPLHYRTVLTLFYLEELSYEEICDVTKLPMGTIKTQLYRARTALQKLLSQMYSKEEVLV
jgi:RNA polymerase sigma-70 factor (ECF subfamily)